MQEYKKSNQSFLRQFNHKKVLNILRTRGAMSRVDLAEISLLDKKTITNIVKDMLNRMQVAVISTRIEGSGRPKQILNLRRDFCNTIGLDIGGTHISAVLLNFLGETIRNNTIDTSRLDDYQDILKKCDQVLADLMTESKIDHHQIIGIGICFPGVVDQETGTAIVVENLPALKNKNLRDHFERKYQKHVYLEDCSRAMALAELWRNNLSEFNDFIVFDLGLGIGCGIIINRELFYGAKGKSGEIGHTIVDVEGPLCTCGRHGCIESLASGWALSKRINDLIHEDKEAVLSITGKAECNEISPKEIVAAANSGNKTCTHLLQEAGRHIGIGVANSIMLFNPTKIILGGRLVKDNKHLINSIIRTAKEETITELWNDAEIRISEIGDFASAIGAGLLPLREYFE